MAEFTGREALVTVEERAALAINSEM